MTPTAPITIVSVNYNTGPHLRRFLDSVATAASDAAVIVVDNASQDGSAATVAGRPNVRLVQNPSNVGFGRAVNQAVAQATTDVVLLVNPDCELRADSICPCSPTLPRIRTVRSPHLGF